MPDNRQAQDNAVSNQSTDNIEEAIQRLKIHDNHDGGVVQSSPYPDRPGEPDCLYYLRTGLCGYGSNCRFNHPAYAAQGAQHREELPERVGQPDCGYFLKTGTCKYGSTCKYHHPKDRNGAGPVTFNVLGLPMRQDEKSCPYYMRTGSCKYGVACKFHHPQPASASYGSGLPANGSMGSSVLQSSGLPYVSGLPTWSLPRAPYVSGSQLPSPQGQGYLPVLLSPSQGMLPAQGWSTYIENLNSASSASTLGSNLLYGSVTPTQSGAVGQTQLISTSSSSLPERPDQPECRYYMNTGTCKYGSDCKYHHPRERTTNPVADTIGPLGLPLRPGQAVCSNYSMYGICKYGPTCRYDHPFVGYSYGYGLSLPPLSVLDSSFLTYPRMSAIPHLSESSLSSKLPDWSQSPNSASEKYRNSESKNPDDATEQGGSPHSLQASSETSQD